MAKELRCADVNPGCPFVARGADMREVIAAYMAHVDQAHGTLAMTPEARILAMVAVRDRPA
jgi:predicted small metal-binding protein